MEEGERTNVLINVPMIFASGFIEAEKRPMKVLSNVTPPASPVKCNGSE